MKLEKFASFKEGLNDVPELSKIAEELGESTEFRKFFDDERTEF